MIYLKKTFPKVSDAIDVMVDLLGVAVLDGTRWAIVASMKSDSPAGPPVTVLMRLDLYPGDPRIIRTWYRGAVTEHPTGIKEYRLDALFAVGWEVVIPNYENTPPV